MRYIQGKRILKIIIIKTPLDNPRTGKCSVPTMETQHEMAVMTAVDTPKARGLRSGGGEREREREARVRLLIILYFFNFYLPIPLAKLTSDAIKGASAQRAEQAGAKRLHIVRETQNKTKNETKPPLPDHSRRMPNMAPAHREPNRPVPSVCTLFENLAKNNQSINHKKKKKGEK